MGDDARHVVITGANRGLGLALVREAVARGDRVWATVRDPERAADLHDADPAGILALDVGDPDAVLSFGAALAAVTDRVDVLVNNAGANGTAFGAAPEARGVLELAPEVFMDEMRVNALGPMLVTRAVLPLLRAAPEAWILNVSSQLGSLAMGREMRTDIGYNASKAALNMVTVATAGALAGDGVRALAVHPGWVRTDMGGAEAPLDAETSARGILDLLAGATPEMNGGFRCWDGRKHPW